MPTVSILLPVYNSAPELPRAISSLLNQTYTDFEIIAINDGSTDESGNLLDRFAQKDHRIKVIHQPNAGNLGTTLNTAANAATGRLFARHDADDASAPNRIADQVDYLTRNPGISLCGTWTWFIDSELGPLFSLELPDSHLLLQKFLLQGKNPFVHGSTMFRADIFQKLNGYRGSYAEDFDLWLRIAERTSIGMCPTLGYYFWRSISGISIGANLRQQALVKLYLALHHERKSIGEETLDWNAEYQKILKIPVNTINAVDRQASMHYSRGIRHLINNNYPFAKAEFENAAKGSGEFAKKAQRNLSFFWMPQLLALLYRMTESREPQHFAKIISPGTKLPKFE